MVKDSVFLKKIEGKDEKKNYIKHKSMYHAKAVKSSSKKERNKTYTPFITKRLKKEEKKKS